MKEDFVFVKDSKIHKKGVFASKDFKKGEVVICLDTSKTITKTEYDKLKEKEKDYIPVIKGKYIVAQEPEKYVNHSCEFNTETKNFCDVAIRNIKKGEEITTDYFKDPLGRDLKCNCGSQKCRRFIS